MAPLANIVCEEDSNCRLAWSLLRFTASALVGPNYRLGPLDREHGFNPTTFADERVYMLIGGMHIWTCNKYILTPDIIAVLLREAIEAQ